MIVTDKEYFMEKKYTEKLDLLIKRLEGTDDVVIIIDGDEGQGKTEFSAGTCYYVSQMMGRKYDVNNIFFNLDEVIDFAAKTKEQIIHFDEAALGLLTTQWQQKAQQKFIQLIMTSRKKKHFILICIPKFHRLPQYVIEERTIGMVHIYSRKDMQKGRFCYFTKKRKNSLYHDWTKKKIKNYKKYHSFHGSFPLVMEKIFDDEGLKEYERKKDEAIMSITATKQKPREAKWMEQRNRLIVGLRKKLNLNSPAVQELLISWGVEITASQIRELTTLYGQQIPLQTKNT